MLVLDAVSTELMRIGLCAGVTVALLLFAASAYMPERWREFLPPLVGLAVVGAAAGISGGLSRVGVVGDIVPAALALVGGVSAYLFGTKINPVASAKVGFAAAAFAMALSLGYATGAAKRAPTDALQAEAVACRSMLTDVALLKDQAALTRALQLRGYHCAEVLAATKMVYFEPVQGVTQDQARALHVHALWNDMKRLMESAP